MTQLTKLPNQDAPYRSYLLRIWQTDANACCNDADQRYTFVLQAVDTGERIGFRSQAAFVNFLETQHEDQL